jgi:hypothetical protein
MKRLLGRSGMMGRWCLLAMLSTGSLGAAPGPPPPPPPQGTVPGETIPPTCRPEVVPDTNCRSGFRTVQVCYQGSRVVSSTIGQCVPPASVTSPNPSKPGKPPKPPKVPE